MLHKGRFFRPYFYNLRIFDTITKFQYKPGYCFILKFLQITNLNHFYTVHPNKWDVFLDVDRQICCSSEIFHCLVVKKSQLHLAIYNLKKFTSETFKWRALSVWIYFPAFGLVCAIKIVWKDEILCLFFSSFDVIFLRKSSPLTRPKSATDFVYFFPFF